MNAALRRRYRRRALVDGLLSALAIAAMGAVILAMLLMGGVQ